jgi:hypothetical protein
VAKRSGTLKLYHPDGFMAWVRTLPSAIDTAAPAVGLRISPDQVVPADLAGKIDYSLEQSQSTKH